MRTRAYPHPLSRPHPPDHSSRPPLPPLPPLTLISPQPNPNHNNKNKTNNRNRNKVSHVDNVKHRNFTFVAHPTGFLVHRQHARSSADKMYQEQKGRYEEQQQAAKGGAGAAQEQGVAAGGESEGAADAVAESKRNLAALTHGFRDAMLEAMRGRRYVPAVDEGVAGCLRQLGWWKGYTGMDL